MTAEKFHRLGFDFSMDEIITSRDALKVALAAARPQRWGVMATDQSQIDELGVEVILLESDPKDYASVDGFVLLGSGEWTDGRQQLLIAATRDHPRPILVGNPDIVAPRETGLTFEPGFYAHDLARHTACVPQFSGKPFGNIFDLVSERIGAVDPARTVMVGDTLHTDVLGGAAFGLKTVLLTDYGLFAEEAVDPLIASSGIVPDVIAHKL